MVLGKWQEKVTKKDIGTYDCLFWQDRLLKAVKDILRACVRPLSFTVLSESLVESDVENALGPI